MIEPKQDTIGLEHSTNYWKQFDTILYDKPCEELVKDVIKELGYTKVNKPYKIKQL